METVEDQITTECQSIVAQFKQITRGYAFFHLSFFALAASELIVFLLFFSFFAKSSLLAFALAAFFLTGFSYFVLLFYFQTKKPEQIRELRETFLKQCEANRSLENEAEDRHLYLASALATLARHFEHVEHDYYSLPQSFSTFLPLMQKFSVWAHWKDLHDMKEMLHVRAIHERLELVKKKPTDLEAHANLAQAYFSMACICKKPAERRAFNSWTPAEYSSPSMQQKFLALTEKSLEEFKIVEALGDHQDTWVHSQIAALYGELKKPQEQISTYETLLSLSPQDSDVMLKLGTLYFQQGKNSMGLRLYEQLRYSFPEKAQELISYYGASQ